VSHGDPKESMPSGSSIYLRSPRGTYIISVQL